jgi:hypothetical protein
MDDETFVGELELLLFKLKRAKDVPMCNRDLRVLQLRFCGRTCTRRGRPSTGVDFQGELARSIAVLPLLPSDN